MKILHTSDWHLGAAEGTLSLLSDQKFFVDWICDIAKEQSIEAVIIAGDVYDRSVASGDAIKLYDYAMTRLCSELGISTIVIAGNHDSAERLSSCRELLVSAGLYVSGSLEKEPTKVEFEDTDIYLLPWITEAKVKSVFPEKKEEIGSLEEAYRVVMDSIREKMDKSKKNIIVAHAFITDSETSTSDRAAEIGFATQVSGSVFEGFDYVALGHIHKPQDVSENIRYSGTPMPYSFGKEESQEKSVTIIDTDDMSRTVVTLELLHARNTISGTLNEVLNGDYPEDVKSGYVRVQISDEYIGLSTLSDLKEIFPNILEASGKTFEGGESTVILTMEEFEELESSPIEIFKHFCREELNEEPNEHLVDLFEQAINSAEEA